VPIVREFGSAHVTFFVTELYVALVVMDAVDKPSAFQAHTKDENGVLSIKKLPDKATVGVPATSSMCVEGG
jgi:hypothetical protein